MYWRTVLLATVLAAGVLTTACRESTPTSPGSAADAESSESSRPTPPPNPPTPPPASGSCDASKALWALGQRASDDLLERARIAAGAESARFLRPNQAVTLEYLGSRLNLGLDARDVVRAIVCG